MLNERLTVARTVTTNLVELEKQLDSTLVMHSQLQITLIEGRRSANLPLDAGQAGLEKLAAAAASLIAARKAVHEAHYEFRAVRDGMRIPAQAYGDQGDTPDAMKTFAAAPLAVVANAA